MVKVIATIVTAFIGLLITIPVYAEAYQDCILKYMKGVNDKTAARIVAAACQLKITPKKCRTYITSECSTLDGISVYDSYTARGLFDPTSCTVLFDCLKESANAGWWSRNFGECSISPASNLSKFSFQGMTRVRAIQDAHI